MNHSQSLPPTSDSSEASARPAEWSHYPAIPPPVRSSLALLPDHPCPYLSGRVASDRAVWASSIPAGLYERFMDVGFRRSGKLLYQPACRGCRACSPIRVPVDRFRPDKSQRRCARRNEDLRITFGPPKITSEKFDLYRAYLRDWHGRPDPEGPAAFEAFLYDSPLDRTVEFEYRDSGRLVAVGICDLCPRSLSSVYFYFDPAESRRSLGTFGAIREIAFAASLGLSYYYLGYWVGGCRTMSYKRLFRPNELLYPDGVWRAFEGGAGPQ